MFPISFLSLLCWHRGHLLHGGELDRSRVFIDHIRLCPHNGGLCLPSPPQSELLLPPPDVGVQNGVEEEVGGPALPEEPHHQKLEFIKRQRSVLEKLRGF